ncbi:MAG TPA: hypothetical protein VHM31_22560 [Polyangia bacterium]|nr:hypothetical protein [Polyangia bacterium]
MRAGQALTLVATVALPVVVASCHRGGLPPRPDGAAVVVTAEQTDDGAPTTAEAEPNDTAAAAQRLALTETTAAAVAGDLAARGAKRDTDLFRVETPQGDAGAGGQRGDAGPLPPRLVLRVDLRPGAGLAVALDALDQAGHLLVAAAGGAGEAIAIPNLAVTGGVVLLRVRAVGPEGATPSYRLAARLVVFDTGAEIEPNGDAAHAGELPLGGEAVGYLGWHRDQDWYRLGTAGAADGSLLSADLDPVADVAATLQLLDADSHKLSEARGRKGERVALRNVRIPAGAPSVFLVVKAEAGWSGTARYNLRSRAELPRAGTEAEPNDDVAHAQPVEDGTALGYLARGDVDVYRYTTAGIALLDVEVEPPERESVQVELLREDGTLLARADSGRHVPARISGASIPGGPVFVRVSPRRGAVNADEPYRLTITSRPPGT